MDKPCKDCIHWNPAPHNSIADIIWDVGKCENPGKSHGLPTCDNWEAARATLEGEEK